MNAPTIKNEKGFNLIELMAALAVVGILTAVVVPSYRDFYAGSMVKEASVELMMEMKLLRTMAIREGQSYTVLFDLTNNTYSIGQDPNESGVPGNYGTTGSTRVINLQNKYAGRVIFGSSPDLVQAPRSAPNSCPLCMGTGTAVSFGVLQPLVQIFRADGTILQPPGHAFLTHTTRNTTYMVKLSYLTGKLELWKWDGDADNVNPTEVQDCLSAQRRCCGWTEAR